MDFRRFLCVESQRWWCYNKNNDNHVCRRQPQVEQQATPVEILINPGVNFHLLVMKEKLIFWLFLGKKLSKKEHKSFADKDYN